jgi:hypothetical protein
MRLDVYSYTSSVCTGGVLVSPRTGSMVPGVAPRLIEAGNPESLLSQAINSWSQAQVPGRPITRHRVEAVVAALEARGIVLAVLEPGA